MALAQEETSVTVLRGGLDLKKVNEFHFDSN